ncbi:tudor domain-containing protein [Phthorimaea operculella]|nr:tudor domain-containing protein [Phthorimaea operculella]
MRLSREGIEIQQGSSPWPHQEQTIALKQGQNSAKWARRFYLQVRSLKELDDLVRELKMRLSREGIEIQQGSSPWPHQEQTLALKQRQNPAQWARRFYLQVRSLKELDDLVRELKMRLSREGIEIQQGSSPWPHQEQTIALKLVMAGAMYPQYFVQASQDESREREAVRTLGGHDPRNTVYLKNFPDNQPGEIYASSIKKAIQKMIGDEPRVTFDNNSAKVYITFNDTGSRHNKDHQATKTDPTIPGQVVLPIYKAIKARQLKLDVRIPLLPPEKANMLAKALKEQNLDINYAKIVPRLPDIDETHFSLIITEKINVGRFWVQHGDESTANELRQIQAALNRTKLIANTGPVSVGEIYAGPFVGAQGTTMHRVRVLRLLPRDMVEVIFIDYGNVIRLNVINLYELPPGIASETPPLAMQCVLAEIGPSPLLDQHAQWSPKAEQLFSQLTSKPPLYGKVTVSDAMRAQTGPLLDQWTSKPPLYGKVTVSDAMRAQTGPLLDQWTSKPPLYGKTGPLLDQWTSKPPLYGKVTVSDAMRAGTGPLLDQWTSKPPLYGKVTVSDAMRARRDRAVSITGPARAMVT